MFFVRLLLGNIKGGLSNDPGTVPECPMSTAEKLEKDSTVLKGPPGYQVGRTKYQLLRYIQIDACNALGFWLDGCWWLDGSPGNKSEATRAGIQVDFK